MTSNVLACLDEGCVTAQTELSRVEFTEGGMSQAYPGISRRKPAVKSLPVSWELSSHRQCLPNTGPGAVHLSRALQMEACFFFRSRDGVPAKRFWVSVCLCCLTQSVQEPPPTKETPCSWLQHERLGRQGESVQPSQSLVRHTDSDGRLHPEPPWQCCVLNVKCPLGGTFGPLFPSWWHHLEGCLFGGGSWLG